MGTDNREGGELVDTNYMDALFDAAMAQTGQPPFTFMFDRRILFPLEMLPDLVDRESDVVLEPGRIDEIRAAGWFRVETSDGLEGVPLFIASRVGLFLELEETGYRHSEMREFAEYEDYMVDEIYCSQELAYDDDDLRLLIAENELRVEHAENSLRVIDQPGWTPEFGSWQGGVPRDQIVESLALHQKNLEALRRFQEAGSVPESAQESVQKFAYRVRMANEFTRVNMVESDRAKVAAGFSFFVWFDGMTLHSPGQTYEPAYPIDWASTMRRPWLAEELDRRLFLPGLLIEGDDVRLSGPVPPSRYDELWRTYSLDDFFRERAGVREERICLNCLSPLGEDADPRKRYCTDACRNAAKQKRFRQNNPMRDLEHKRRYYSSLPELGD